MIFGLLLISEQCKKPNEVFRKCGASCEPSCNDRYKRFCNSECRDGCACKDGYVRDNYGNCVYPDQCPNGKGLNFIVWFVDKWKIDIDIYRHSYLLIKTIIST